MKIRKRNGQEESYRRGKIERVIGLAFESVGQTPGESVIGELAQGVERKLLVGEGAIPVEHVQDIVEEALMVGGHYEAARSFILYRNERRRLRAMRATLMSYFGNEPELDAVLKELQQEFPGEEYSLNLLTNRFHSFYRRGIAKAAALEVLTGAAAELTSRDAPLWQRLTAVLKWMPLSVC